MGRGIFAENLLNQIPDFSHVEEGGKRSSFLHFRACVRNNENKERLDKNRPKRGRKSSFSLSRGPGPCCIRTYEASPYSSRIMMERVCSGGCCASRDPPPPPPPLSLPPSLVHTHSLLSPLGRCLLRSCLRSCRQRNWGRGRCFARK